MNGEINKVKEIKKKFWLRLVIVIIFLLIPLIIFAFYQSNNFSFNSNDDSEIKSTSAEVLIVGDIMLDRNVRNIIDKKGFDQFFSGVKDLIQRADIAVGNLEGAITPYPSVTASLVNKDLQFTFDPSMASALANLGFDILGLANNHSFNYGTNGLEMTRRYIGSAGMLYYGDPFNKDEISTVVTRNGIKIGFVGFHEFYYENFDKVLFEISRLKRDVDVVIVNPHWGIEYQKEPTEKMVEWAHQFIDLGADVVVGAHPHIVGTTEIYKGKKIYYSLGNFAFDQYFSKATMEGLGVIIEIDKKGDLIDFKYKDVPIKIDRDGVRVDKR